MTNLKGTTPCEYLLSTDPVVFCGKVAVRRYPAMGGGFMHLCLAHGKQHESYAEQCYEGERE